MVNDVSHAKKFFGGIMNDDPAMTKEATLSVFWKTHAFFAFLVVFSLASQSPP